VADQTRLGRFRAADLCDQRFCFRIAAMNDEKRPESTGLLDEQTRQLIAGSVAEMDIRQIAISRHLTPAQRVKQGCAMIAAAERVSAYRLRSRQPTLSELEALRIVRERMD